MHADWPKPWYADPWQVAIACLYVGMFGLAASCFLPRGWFSKLTPADWFTLAGAAATFMAGIVALWLGLAAMNKTDRDNIARARLVAERVAVVVELLMRRFLFLAATARAYIPAETEPAAMDFLTARFAAPIEEIPLELLVQLQPLAPTAAADLARALALLDILHRDFAGGTVAWAEHGRLVAATVLAGRLPLLDEAAGLLYSASEKLAGRRASPPR